MSLFVWKLSFVFMQPYGKLDHVSHNNMPAIVVSCFYTDTMCWRQVQVCEGKTYGYEWKSSIQTLLRLFDPDNRLPTLIHTDWSVTRWKEWLKSFTPHIKLFELHHSLSQVVIFLWYKPSWYITTVIIDKPSECV